MELEGRVIGKNGDGTVIRIIQAAECSGCSSCGGKRDMRLVVKGDKAAGLRPGERVRVDIGSADMMRYYVLFYGLPLGAFLAGLFTVFFVTRSELLALGGALALTAAAYILTALRLKKGEVFEKVHIKPGEDGRPRVNST